MAQSEECDRHPFQIMGNASIWALPFGLIRQSLRVLSIGLGFVILFLVLGCQVHNSVNPMPLQLSSSAFSSGQTIPIKYTCEGQDLSPPLEWTGLPAETKSLALIIDDPDAPDPDAPKMTWVHWILYNIPPSTKGLSEGVTAFPSGTLEGLNDWKRTRYGGPCPPIGSHRYFHKLYALDTVLSSLKQPTKAQLEKAMEGHIIASAEYIGIYRKSKP
jgi:Raf kinase inhibitor-like YbhB/YbcL family protein